MHKLLFPLLAPILLAPIAVHADDIKPPANTPQNVLPLRDVALFSSGVGYFGRSGQVEGNASVPLTVRAPQISDLLKSLVIFDPKGTVRPVTYSLQDWMQTRQRETDLSLPSSATPGALLQGFQGAVVRLEKGEIVIEGRILSVSSRQVKTESYYMPVEVVTLLTTTGIQTVRLDDVTSFRLLDPALDAKLRATLETKASSLTRKLDDGARSVTLHFEGKSKRDVRAGYLLETPAWKTSYRLVLEPKKQPYLQGWAIVENTTDEDWNQVHLSLISGRPISFIQDLATPVYVSRPVVPPQIIGSPRPQTFGEGFQPANTNTNALTNQSTNGAPPGLYDEGGSNLKNRITALEARPVPDISRQQMADLYRARNGMLASVSQNINGNQQSQATGTERGELFEYAIDGATTVPSGQAAMVPIVSTDIGGEAVTIVETSLSKGDQIASNGFCLRNSSGLHLQGGPITIFSGGIYAGDALINNLSPKDSRLIAYAVDLELVAKQDEPETTSSITKLSVTDGVLQVRRNLVKTRHWSFKNKSGGEKTVLLEVPDEAGWKLADPKQMDEKTADATRFRIKVAPGEASYEAKWTQQTVETVVLYDSDVPQLQFYTSQQAISPALKAKIADIVAQKQRISDLVAQRALQEAALKDITDDQERIRNNMEPLEKNSALFKTYEAKLSAQEDKIERVRAEITRLRDAENEARTTLKNLVAGLDLE